MPNIQNLNKLFVHVPGDKSYTIADVSAESVKTDNQKKIYFIEKEKTIVNNGVAYGINPSTAQSLEDLIAVVGQEKLGTGNSFDASTVIQRLQRLENLNVSTGSENYLSITNQDNHLVNPSIGIKVVPIKNNTQGLVDAVNAKSYIDQEVAKATSKVEVGTGLKLDVSANADNSSTYKVSPDFTIAYVGANTEAGTDAQIIIKSNDDASTFGFVNVSDIIGNGFLKDSDYDPATGLLTLTFNQGGDDVSYGIDLHEMLDINDMSIKNDSSVYLKVTLDGEEGEAGKTQAVFEALTQDVSTAAANATGLADAWEVKQYVDSKSTNLAVSAEGDDYVDASVDAGNNKKINVAANVGNVTVSGGTRGTWTVSDAGVASLAGETAPTMTADSSKLLDASQAVESVKVYVDAKVAAEAAEREAKIEAAIKGLDSENTSTGKNVTVNASIVDGELTTLGVTESYATVTGTRTDSTTNPVTGATFTVTSGDESKLIKASDLVTLKNYTDDKIAENAASLGITANGDSYVSVDVSANDNKHFDVSVNLSDLTIGTDGTGNSTLTGVSGKLVDANELSTKVQTFVNGRLGEEIGKLDSVVNKTDASNYVSVSTGIVDGKLADASCAVAVTYGSFTTENTPGIAKVEDVQTFVDEYDFWENYTAPAPEP